MSWSSNANARWKEAFLNFFSAVSPINVMTHVMFAMFTVLFIAMAMHAASFFLYFIRGVRVLYAFVST